MFLGNTSIAYLMSYLEKYFPDDLIYPAPDLEFLLRTSPDIVGISAPYSETFSQVTQLARAIKEKFKIPVVLGGQHITHLPKSLPPLVDIGVIGEGEETFRDLITIFKEQGEFNELNLAKVPGIVFHKRGQRVTTEKRKVIMDIDSIPLTRKFFYGMSGNWIPTMTTGRGSLHKTFDTAPVDGPLRLHSAERLVEDIVDIITFYPNQRALPLPITDEYFLYDLERLKKFAEIVSETGLNKHFSLALTARPQYLTEEVCLILKLQLKSVSLLNVSFVSASTRIQKELRHPVSDRELRAQTLDRCLRYDFSTNITFYIGSPTETREDLAKNYWYIRNNYAEIYKTFNFVTELILPYPGTEGWQKAIMKRLVTENPPDWNIFNAQEITKETPVLNLLHQKGEFINIFKTYKSLIKYTNDDKITINMVANKRTPLFSSLRAVMENVLKSGGIKSILQITDKHLFTLENIFYDQDFIIENIAVSAFNKSKKVKAEKKYDCIVLFFTLELAREPEKVLKFCYESLTDDGLLMINFLNTREYNTLFEIIKGYDFTDLFQGFVKLNPFTQLSINNLLIKNKFRPKKFNRVYTVNDAIHSEYSMVIIKTLKYYFPGYKDEEIITKTYTVLCRKIKN